MKTCSKDTVQNVNACLESEKNEGKNKASGQFAVASSREKTKQLMYLQRELQLTVLPAYFNDDSDFPPPAHRFPHFIYSFVFPASSLTKKQSKSKQEETEQSKYFKVHIENALEWK